jgi:carboxypeptidase Q
MKLTFTALALLCVLSSTSSTQAPIELATVARIKQEALTRSQVMDHVGWMSDVYGPRITGTPNYARAAEWAARRFNEWKLSNVHQERFAFGQGWRVERFSAHIVSPEPQPIIGFPRTYSPSTKGTITGDVVRVNIRTEADLARYKGQLKDKIVLPQPARRVRMLEDRVILRMNDKDIERVRQVQRVRRVQRVRQVQRVRRVQPTGRYRPTASRRSSSLKVSPPCWIEDQTTISLPAAATWRG